MILFLWIGGSSIVLVLEEVLKDVLGGLGGALPAVESCSTDILEASTSRAADRWRVSSLRSACHDFVLSRIGIGSDISPGNAWTVALLGRPSRCGPNEGDDPLLPAAERGAGAEVGFSMTAVSVDGRLDRGANLCGLVDLETAEWPGRGEIGTFHTTASSGISSSESWYSASSSLTDLRLWVRTSPFFGPRKLTGERFGTEAGDLPIPLVINDFVGEGDLESCWRADCGTEEEEA